ncbi:MAG TPA: hypothetical protein VGW36_06470, partial [Pyrinomonadaceae bacterium]|nr:hypothetical protein [Pyrinomonadaceae bacterium]
MAKSEKQAAVAEKVQPPTNGPKSAMERVQLARHPDRPYTLDFIERLFEEFVELHGDRRFADDP